MWTWYGPRSVVHGAPTALPWHIRCALKGDERFLHGSIKQRYEQNTLGTVIHNHTSGFETLEYSTLTQSLNELTRTVGATLDRRTHNIVHFHNH